MNGHRQRASVLLASLIAAWQLGATGAVFAAQSASVPAAQSAAKDDKTAVELQLNNLSRAVIAGDAKMLANLWTADCTYTDDDGNLFNGRKNLEEHFNNLFQSAGGFAIDIAPEQFRMLSKGVAMSEGWVKRGDDAALDTRYSIILVNQGGKWLISTATETAVAQKPIASQISQLEWLLGEWTAENNGAKVHVKTQWAGVSKNFMICKYEIQKPNQPVESETQVIGWDPRIDSIVSWHFDSNGGFAHGKWTKTKGKWLIAFMGVSPDGQSSEALNIISPKDANDFSWQSVRRSVGGVSVPGTEPLTVRRVAANNN